ncbi:MAG: glycoside hydrolase family 32 protein [Anaerovibrio sp.]|uniref:hypothetical protein n=1 Tax=Anaerovibrio sp. TaxID=1872532 RepID=UPI0025B9C898|nr:hypothetical protein [Anaerovibrio sp.]MBE6099378.1 glycoside hydrolase family 32 protein [Anaerovibrio sp.]
MMKWQKCGKIFDHNTFDLDWFKKNAMMPLPYVLNDKILRIFVTLCDEENIGRIGYVDVDINCPSRIIGFSQNPVIDVGEPGTYDDNGVVTGSLFENEDGLYLFYSGYQLCRRIPYMIFSGAAISVDGGNSFKKIHSDAPMLDRVESERNFRCVPNIMQQGTTFKMWYLADCCVQQSAWLKNDAGKMQPIYSEKYLESNSLLNWKGPGQSVLEFSSDDEHGLSIGSIWLDDKTYKCIYSIRSLSNGYRLGYAESVDGIHFTRKDAELNLDVTPGDFDSEMMCYAKLINMPEHTYLFYSGNHYGMAGIGYAELIE